jgi:hypothetical protein
MRAGVATIGAQLPENGSAGLKKRCASDLKTMRMKFKMMRIVFVTKREEEKIG